MVYIAQYSRNSGAIFTSGRWSSWFGCIGFRCWLVVGGGVGESVNERVNDRVCTQGPFWSGCVCGEESAY
jgi:hypothetical protein